MTVVPIAKTFAAALAAHRAGRLEDAEALYRRILAVEPNHGDSLHYLGLIAHQVGRHDLALELIGRAIALNGRVPEFHNNIGEAHRALGQLGAAIEHYHRAIALRAGYVEAHYNLANTLCDQGRMDEAVARYRRALTLRPDYAEAHNNLGTVLHAQGHLDEAIKHYRRVVALRPEIPEVHYNLGTVLQDQGNLATAMTHYEKALGLRPGYVEAHYNLGIVLRDQGRLPEAAAHYRQALALRPDYAEAHNNLGNLLKDQGRLEDAVSCFTRALELRPDYAEAHSNLLFTQLYRPGVTLAGVLAAAQGWNGAQTRGLRAAWPCHDPKTRDGGPLRLGFVSGDFRNHVIGHHVIPTLERLAAAGHRLTCYSNNATEDALTARFKAAAATWRPVSRLTDQALAETIRNDGIDILFDLSGHTAYNRLLVFARKPAPVQVCWVGYPATTGLEAMDYFLNDRHQIPDGAEAYYQEKVVRLPNSYMCYEPVADAPPVAAQPYDANGHVTFGSFNEVKKITPQAIAVWSEILRRLPTARLLLKATRFGDPDVQDRYRHLFGGHGIASERLDFVGATSPAEHMAFMSRADLALDTFPFTGGATTVDALWMGVPVITCPGETISSRHSLGHLTHAGLTELIAPNLDRYVALAVELAQEPVRLAGLRAGLRPRLAASPLCAGESFVRHVEAAVTAMGERYLSGQPPEAFSVAG